MEQIYWTVGPHDLVGVFESPDDESLSAFLLELAAAGNVRSTTLRAYDREEMTGILGLADPEPERAGALTHRPSWGR